MTVNITLIVLMAALFAAGIYLLLERSLTRVLLGLILMGNSEVSAAMSASSS
jgi:multicomponent Na+:H+ antiporter subunit C